MENMISNNMGHFILGGLVCITLILWVLACISVLFYDIPLRFCEFYSSKWRFFWCLPARLGYCYLACMLVCVFLAILFGLIGIM